MVMALPLPKWSPRGPITGCQITGCQGRHRRRSASMRSKEVIVSQGTIDARQRLLAVHRPPSARRLSTFLVTVAKRAIAWYRTRRRMRRAGTAWICGRCRSTTVRPDLPKSPSALRAGSRSPMASSARGGRLTGGGRRRLRGHRRQETRRPLQSAARPLAQGSEPGLLPASRARRVVSQASRTLCEAPGTDPVDLGDPPADARTLPADD
jgi:hypothetical protein